MAPVIIGSLVVIAAVVALVVVQKARDGRDERDRRSRLRILGRIVEREHKAILDLREAQRLNTIAALFQGKKCRGCARTVKADEIEEVGEDPRGRPIELCPDCRNLAS